MDDVRNFVLSPVGLMHGLLGSLYIGFLLLLFVTWLSKNLRNKRSGSLKHNLRSKNGYLFYKRILFCCVALVLLNVFMCFLNLFYWYRNGRTDESINAVKDTFVGTIVWLVVSVYVHTHVSSSRESRCPPALRIWWVSFFSISCFSLVLDYLDYTQNQYFAAQFVVFDALSALFGAFLCYFGLSGNSDLNEGETINHSYQKLESVGPSVTPSTTRSVFSLLTFSWIQPLIAKGYKKPLDLEDIPELDSSDSASGACSILRSKLESYKKKNSGITTYGLVKAVIWTTWKDIIITALLSLVLTLASYVGPLLIDTFIEYLNGHRDSKQGLLLVSAFSVANIVACLAQQHRDFRLVQVGIRAKAALVSAIYFKSLKLSAQSKQGQSNGEIVNFMAVDAERIYNFSRFMHNTWLIAVQVSLGLAILYKNLGLSSLTAFVAIIIVVFANIPLGSLQGKFQREYMKYKDKRMKATSEILNNMRILKLHGWEMKFLLRIENIRNEESHWLYKFVFTVTMSAFVFWIAPTFVATATFVTCILLGIPLDLGKVLSALATFKILQESVYSLPETVSMVAQTKVSFDRIASFLRLDELDSNTVEMVPRGSSNTAVEIVDGSFSWDVKSSTPTLSNIDLRVVHGTRVAVCGVVGSGKSSLLSCILGELPKLSGHVKLSGTKAYVGQSPWIQSGTIEENVLFCKEMDIKRYNKVLEACDLKKDLEVLSFGDQTVIGERGINLSGGQKQRIQIARALYQDADIYLFDDPFSAVDAHTGSHIFRECMLGFLESKTVIYVTHQVEFLPDADLILVLKDGRIAQAGTYDNILNSGTDIIKLVGAHKEALLEIDYEGKKVISDTMDVIENQGSEGTMKKQLREETKSSQNGKKRQLVEVEERGKGKIGFSVYRKYLTTAYGGALVPLILLVHTTFEILQILSNYWMAWAYPELESNEARAGDSKVIMIYVAFGIGCSFSILARLMLLMKAAYETANQLFYNMHFCVFRAPMSFFDANPSGRVLNRASADQSAVDLTVPYNIGPFSFMVIQLLGVIVVMSFGAWSVFLVFFPVFGMCILLQEYYQPSARELARLVGVCSTPMIQHFSETISGSKTIRSFDQQQRFKDTCLKLIDNGSRPKLHVSALSNWLGLRVDMLSSFTFISTLIFLVYAPEGAIDPSTAGLAVTYGLFLNKLQGSVIKKYGNMETLFISVERIFQYSSIPSEPPLVIDSKRPDRFWPSHGRVDIHGLQVRYGQHMPLVLRGITCSFHGGTKTGIVGRTGSGKSTLIQTLFRIVEPTYGEILIDGINIASIGLHDLRSRLSIIPQDPTMFNGTVRSNMDPLEEYTDDQIWEALDKCHIGDEVRKKEGQLDSTVNENGENWSMGQQQLVCLGRVLLKKSKILVLDEATASVDTATDNMIQKTIRQHFSDSTVITIAHRITSVISSDMVLVLNDGLIEEYDSPMKLLEGKSSSFSKLVAEYNKRSNTSHTSTNTDD